MFSTTQMHVVLLNGHGFARGLSKGSLHRNVSGCFSLLQVWGDQTQVEVVALLHHFGDLCLHERAFELGILLH